MIQIEKQNTKRAEKVNLMKKKEIKKVIKSMKKKRHIIKKDGYWNCVPGPNKKGGYAQVDITNYCKEGSGVTKKVLVHHIYWRYKNDYQKIASGKEISHLHADNTVLDLVEESWELNQSRKWCHFFKWYKPLDGETTPRCPHKECPCKGQ